jgi:hypothetical protein
MVNNTGFRQLQITMSEDESAIAGLDVSKSPGDDGIPPNFTRHCTKGLKSALLHIFNLSLSKGLFPNKWKDSYLFPFSNQANATRSTTTGV